MREMFVLWRNATTVVAVAVAAAISPLPLREFNWGDTMLEVSEEKRITYEREAAEWETKRIALKAEYEREMQHKHEAMRIDAIKRLRPKFMRMVEDDYHYHGTLLWDPITLLEAKLTWCPREQLCFYRWGSSRSSYWERCSGAGTECKHLHRSDVYCREHACTSDMAYALREAHCEDLHDSISIEENEVCNCFPIECNELWVEVPDWRYFGIIKERVLMSELEITTLGISDGFCGKPHGFKPRCVFLHHELHDDKIFCRAHVVANCSTCGDFDGWTRFSIDIDGDMTLWPRWYLHRPRGQAAGQDAVHISDLERRGFRIEVPHDMRIPHPHGYFVKWEFCGQFWMTVKAAEEAEKQEMWRRPQQRKSTGWRS
jgi:hypothetical protein